MNIKEVCERYELSQDTLRYYEKIGLLPMVHRSASGIRNYTEDDCKWVEFIKCMRSAGLTIETLSTYVQLFQAGDSTLGERKTLLLEQRADLASRIAEMQKTLDRLDRKLERYEHVVAKEKVLSREEVLKDPQNLLG